MKLNSLDYKTKITKKKKTIPKYQKTAHNTTKQKKTLFEITGSSVSYNT